MLVIFKYLENTKKETNIIQDHQQITTDNIWLTSSQLVSCYFENKYIIINLIELKMNKLPQVDSLQSKVCSLLTVPAGSGLGAGWFRTALSHTCLLLTALPCPSLSVLICIGSLFCVVAAREFFPHIVCLFLQCDKQSKEKLFLLHCIIFTQTSQ